MSALGQHTGVHVLGVSGLAMAVGGRPRHVQRLGIPALTLQCQRVHRHGVLVSRRDRQRRVRRRSRTRIVTQAVACLRTACEQLGMMGSVGQRGPQQRHGTAMVTGGEVGVGRGDGVTAGRRGVVCRSVDDRPPRDHVVSDGILSSDATPADTRTARSSVRSAPL